MRRQFQLLVILSLVLIVAGGVTASADVATQATVCATDINDDGAVDLYDVVAVIVSLGQQPRPGAPEDVNQDQAVNLFDLVLVLRDYGWSCVRTPCIQAWEAWNHIGELTCVEFHVAGTWNTGDQAFLNSHHPFPGHFYVYIPKDKFGCWPQPPESYFYGRRVRVAGTLELSGPHNSPRIVIQHCCDLNIVG